MSNHRNAFITGATGLVGSHLLMKLLLEGYKVKALVRKIPDFKKTRAIADFYSSLNDDLLQSVTWIVGDITDYFSLLDAIDEGDDVFHCAAFVSFNYADRHLLKQVNEEGTANMVNASIEKKARKFVFVSTIGTLGTPEEGQMTDENCAWQAKHRHSAYSQSKFRAEMEVWRGTKEGLNAVIINPSVVLGPCELNQSTGRLFRLMANAPRFYTTGSTGYVDVRDVANAANLLMQSDISEERYIINGENLQFNTFMELTAKALNINPPSIYATKTMTAIAWRLEWIKAKLTFTQPSLTRDSARIAHSHSSYSSAKFSNTFNYQFTPIKTTINQTVNWLKTNGHI